MSAEELEKLLHRAWEYRQELPEVGDEHTALRLFNGFWEGWPDLAIDLYGSTLLIHGYAQIAEQNLLAASTALEYYRSALPGRVHCALLKDHGAKAQNQRRGLLLAGEQPDTQVRERNVWYALDLRMHQDTSLYLDTRLLRGWASDHLQGKRVLNLFAYTGSLGAATLAGGAQQVIQSDLSSEFLSLAHRTYRLNGWAVRQEEFLIGDFFSIVARLKRQGQLFDCVFLDPPIFSVTEKGRVDLNQAVDRLINKVRPLIGDGGRLVAVNNAVFVSGRAYLETLERLSAGGYLEVEEILPAPPDFTGFNQRPLTPLPADPQPFNYSTKIAVLRIRRKDGRRAFTPQTGLGDKSSRPER